MGLMDLCWYLGVWFVEWSCWKGSGVEWVGLKVLLLGGCSSVYNFCCLYGWLGIWIGDFVFFLVFFGR